MSILCSIGGCMAATAAAERGTQTGQRKKVKIAARPAAMIAMRLSMSLVSGDLFKTRRQAPRMPPAQPSEQPEGCGPPNQKENAAKDKQMRAPWRCQSGKNRGGDKLAVAWNNDDAKPQCKKNGPQMQPRLGG